MKKRLDGYHWHIDFVSMTAELEETLTCEFGMYREDFEAGEYIPGLQLSRKFGPREARAFSEQGRRLCELVEGRSSELVGYVELELVYNDWDIPEKAFTERKLPFRVNLTGLELATFREAEIHVSLDRDASDGRLIEGLRSMGLYCAELAKEDGYIAAVYTVQGSRRDIEALFPQLWDYLQQAGGAVHGSIKMEYVPTWGWFRSPDNFPVPPVVEEIL